MLDAFRWTALAAAVVLVVAFSGAIVLSQQTHTFPQQQSAQENHQKDDNKESDKTLWDRWFPDALSLYTLFLVVFTAVLGAAAIFQLTALNRAEVISAQAARAAQQSVEQASDTARKQLRAYVSPRGGIVSNFGTNQKVEVAIVVKNSGQTPAYDFTVPGLVTAQDFPVPLNDPLPTAYGTTGPSILGPGMEYAVRFTVFRTFTAAENAAFTTGTRALYAYGEIHYRDIFGTQHVGHFKMFFGGKTSTPPSGEMSFYESGNYE